MSDSPKRRTQTWIKIVVAVALCLLGALVFGVVSPIMTAASGGSVGGY